MSNHGTNSVIVELYDLSVTQRKDDRFGKVVITKSLSINDLIAIAVNRRTDLNANTLKASISVLQEIAIEQIANGASVHFGPAFFNLSVGGIFIGDNAKWDPAQNSLVVNAIPTAALREAVKDCKVEVRGMAASGVVINSVTDITTGKVNNLLTPGGGVTLNGSKIKLSGDDPRVGITLINQDNGELVPIPTTSVLVNEPSTVTLLLPDTLENGNYRIQLCTQFSHASRTIKEPRAIIFDQLLRVG